MTVHNHALVWIDHRLAKLFYLGLDAVEQVTIEAHLTTEHLHHKANSIGSGHVEHDPSFFRRIEEVLRNCEAVLIVGPGTEKSLLLKYLKESPHAPAGRDLHASPSDHPSDREIIALGRHHFHLGEPTRL